MGNKGIARTILAVLAMGALGAIVFRPSTPKTGDRRPLRPAAVADGDPAPGFRGERVPQDPEFDRFLSLRTLVQAWGERESTLMTDVTLQLLEGERVLGRPHRVISASDAWSVAWHLALARNDVESQQRLTKVAKQSDGRSGTSNSRHELAPAVVTILDRLAKATGSGSTNRGDRGP